MEMLISSKTLKCKQLEVWLTKYLGTLSWSQHMETNHLKLEWLSTLKIGLLKVVLKPVGI